MDSVPVEVETRKISETGNSHLAHIAAFHMKKMRRKKVHFCSMKITQEVRDYASKHELDAQAALSEGLKEKAAEFVSSGAELYQGELPAGARREH
jgi:hypothetical protein